MHSKNRLCYSIDSIGCIRSIRSVHHCISGGHSIDSRPRKTWTAHIRSDSGRGDSDGLSERKRVQSKLQRRSERREVGNGGGNGIGGI